MKTAEQLLNECYPARRNRYTATYSRIEVLQMMKSYASQFKTKEESKINHQKGITNEEMKIAEENPHYFCYVGSNMPVQHTVGCSHQKWTVEELQQALETQMAVVRVLQHKLFGSSLDGRPTFYCESSKHKKKKI